MMENTSLVKSNKSIPRLHMKNAPSSSTYLKPTSISQFEDGEDNFQKQSFLKSGRNLNIIKIFSIEPDGSLVLTTTSLEEFKQTAFQLHKIKKLDVEFPGESKACNSLMKEILEKVSELTFLEGLSLSFANLEESCESGFQALHAIFTNCIRIRDLRIAFLSCTYTLSHDATLPFEKSLYKLISLETLTLEFSENNCMENDFVSPILSTLSKLSKLTRLNLRVHDCPGLTNYAFAGFAKVGAKLHKLTSLNLELSYLPLLETKGMKFITFALVSMRSLKNLRLSFQSLPGLDDLCIVTFAKELHGFQQVKALSLEFIACNNLGIQGFYALRDFLTNFDQLKKLNVTVFNMPIVMHSMAAVCGAVAVYTGLKELDLDLSYSAYAGQKALIILKDTLSAISRLKSIRFALDGWRETLTDQGMVLLKDSLGGLRHIRSFDLSLAECSNVSDKGFEVFSSMLDYFVELENLRLNFNGCTDLTELGWEHILKGLLKLKGLNKFVIDITGCKKLVESFCQGLLQVIENNKNIVHLEIHACGTYEITDKGAGYLKDAVLFLNKPRFVKLGYNDNRVSVFKIEKLELLLERRLKQTEVDVYGGFVQHTEESYEGETEN